MKKCIIVFGVDESMLSSCYKPGDVKDLIKDVHEEIRISLKSLGFDLLKGTVYVGHQGSTKDSATLAMKRVEGALPWFAKCVFGIQYYEVAQDLKTEFIIDGIMEARAEFDKRISALRAQMLASGLPAAQVSQIIASAVVPK